MITKTPAKILKQNAGQIKEGYYADLVFFDFSKSYQAGPLCKESAYNRLLSCVGNETRYVVCNGNLVVDNYEPVVDFDIEDICDKVNLVAKEFVDYLHRTKIER